MKYHDEAIETFILRELARAANRDDIITTICQRLGIQWADGERLVQQVEHDRKAELLKRKAPFFLIASAIFTGAGLSVALLCFYGITYPIYLIWKNQYPFVEGFNWLQSFGLMFPLLLVGTGMSITGFLGLRKGFRDLRGRTPEELEQPEMPVNNLDI